MSTILDSDFNPDPARNEREKWALYVGPGTEYYLAAWQKMEKGQYAIFHLYAFLFGPFWMLYRKMYLPAALFLGAIVLEGAFENFIFRFLRVSYESQQLLSVAITISFGVLVGLYGNYWYWWDVKRVISILEEKGLPEEKLHAAIQQRGGISWVIPLIVLVLYFAIIGIIYSNSAGF